MRGDVIDFFVADIDDPAVAQRFEMLFAGAQHARRRRLRLSQSSARPASLSISRRMTRSFQSQRMPPLAAHIVVGDGLFCGGAWTAFRAGLDRPRLIAGRQACLPSLELVQFGAILA